METWVAAEVGSFTFAIQFQHINYSNQELGCGDCD